MSSLGEKLKRSRQERGWSLRKAEEKTGISNGYLSLLENGKATSPSPSVLEALARAYELSFDALMALAGHPSGAVHQEGSLAKVLRFIHSPSVHLRSTGESSREGADTLAWVQALTGETKQTPHKDRLVSFAWSPVTSPSVIRDQQVACLSSAAPESNNERAEVIQLLIDDLRGLSIDQIGHVRAYVAGLKAPRSTPR